MKQLILTLMVISVATANAQQKTQRVWDTDFIALHSISAAMTVADLETTRACLRISPRCYEANPIFGKHPSTARLYGTTIPIQAGTVLLSAWIKKQDSGWWRLTPMLNIGLRSFAVTVNLRNR
mgnify:CR=1 FL=1